MSGYLTHSVLYGMPLKLSVNLGSEVRYQAHVFYMTFLPRFPCIRRPCTTWEGRRDIVENDCHSGLVSEILRGSLCRFRKQMCVLNSITHISSDDCQMTTRGVHEPLYLSEDILRLGYELLSTIVKAL
jgi:hypothetical protein